VLEWSDVIKSAANTSVSPPNATLMCMCWYPRGLSCVCVCVCCSCWPVVCRLTGAWWLRWESWHRPACTVCVTYCDSSVTLSAMNYLLDNRRHRAVMHASGRPIGPSWTVCATVDTGSHTSYTFVASIQHHSVRYSIYYWILCSFFLHLFAGSVYIAVVW